jgi:CRP-like cAMP-binding protein
MFSQLGRVDLAKLAGELEEREFAQGTIIVREGEPGDALYVIKSGVARIVVEVPHSRPRGTGAVEALSRGEVSHARRMAAACSRDARWAGADRACPRHARQGVGQPPAVLLPPTWRGTRTATWSACRSWSAV